MAKRYQPAITYKLREVPIKQIKIWKTAQARKLNREGVAELAKSIKAEGLQNPPLIQKNGKGYLLMSGQRRLAALKRLRAKKIPALVLTRNTAYDVHDAKAASVGENIHRKNMDVKDTAAACKFLAEEIGKSKAAQSLGMSMVTFKKFHGFAGVPEKLKELVPKKISRDEATKLHIIIPNLTKSLKMVERISKLDSRTKKAYLRELAKNPKGTHKKLLKKARSQILQRKISFNLSKSKARGLGTQSKRYDMDANEFASKIVKDWLKRKGY